MIFTILIGIFGLGLMIFIHELGHFIAAKANGVEVEVFSLGWGSKLVGFTRGGTRYQISWLPIGGYCKMKGDDLLRRAQLENLSEIPKEEGSFFAAPPWRRIVIAAAGPLFNVASALLIFTLIWWAGFRIFSADNRIVLASDYTLDSFASTPPATTAGMKTGDRVVDIDGKPVEKFQDLVGVVSLSAGKRLLFTVQRGSETLRIPVTPILDKNDGAGKIGVYSWLDPVVADVTRGGPAAFAGLAKGDRITAVDGKQIRNTTDLYQLLSAMPHSVTFSVEGPEQAAERSIQIIPDYRQDKAANLGIEWALPVYRSPRLGLGGALLRSVDECVMTVSLTVKGIGLLFQGINIKNAVAGPLRITYYIGSAATSGFQLGFGQGIVDFFRFLSFLSVVLFLMNLLPLPALDGGQILLFLVEIARGRAVRPRTIGRVQFIGLSLLVTLALFITFSDILYFLGR
jgi:regulator of sigma E protease